jgi:hypothetical protein
MGPQEFAARGSAYADALRFLRAELRWCEGRVPAPQWVPYGTRGHVFRYVEQTPEQALVIKLARQITGLHAATVLFKAGLIEDLGATKRILDEMNEDAQFLAAAIMGKAFTPLHETFLRDFWAEEFDIPDNPMESSQKRGMVPRDKVRAYLARLEESGFDQSTKVKVFKTLAKAFGGFVHGNAERVMEIYGGVPGDFHFQVDGIAGTEPWFTAFEQLGQYFHRAICGMGLAVGALGGDGGRQGSVIGFRTGFEQRVGMSFE